MTCIDCPSPCCKIFIIDLTQADVNMIEENTGKSKESFCTSLFRFEYQMLKVNNSCIFLTEENLCSIYNFRPKTCRDFKQSDRRCESLCQHIVRE